MKTFKFKEALKVLAFGGFIKAPSNYFIKYAPLYDKFGDQVGQITYNCYFELADCLGCVNNGGLRVIDRYEQDSCGCETINGNFSVFKKAA